MASGTHNAALGVEQGNEERVVGAWSSGLFACCDDVGGCFLTIFCPCVTLGRIAEIVDQGTTPCFVAGTLCCVIYAFTFLGGSLYTCTFRSKLRSQYGLPEEPCADCCVHCCCRDCALCQEYRELRARGFNLADGWEGNTNRPPPAATAPPYANQEMLRS